MLTGNSNRRYYIGGYNITKFVKSVDGLSNKQTKPDWGQLPDFPRLELNVFNEAGLFSTLSQGSYFFGSILQNTIIKVTSFQGSLETTEWEGLIENVIEDFETFSATIIGMSYFSKFLDSPTLITLGVDTPANLSAAIFRLYNIPIDETSFATANAIQQNIINCQLDPDITQSQSTLLDVQTKLATAGVARIYSVNGLMRYEVFTTTAPTITFDLSERQIWSHPKISSKELKTQYFTVEHLNGETRSYGFTTGASTTNLGFGVNSDVKITSETGAQYTADGWQNTTMKQGQRNVEVGIDRRLGEMITLDTYLTITYDRVNWFQQPLEIVGIDKTDPKYVIIEGDTV